MTIAACLIGSTDERDFAKCSSELRKAWLHNLLDEQLTIIRVPCNQLTPGWVGCWECHRLAARMAIHNKWPLYLFLESKARPTLRFDWKIVLEAEDYLRKNPNEMIINLSILPWPFKGAPRKQITPHIYKNASAQMNGTTALLCTSRFADSLIYMPSLLPIDLQLAKAGISKLICYPSPFQRNSQESTTTRALLGAKYIRSPWGYYLCELIDFYPRRSLLILVLCVIMVVVIVLVILMLRR